jgi:hypothetical protein
MTMQLTCEVAADRRDLSDDLAVGEPQRRHPPRAPSLPSGAGGIWGPPAQGEEPPGDGTVDPDPGSFGKPQTGAEDDEARAINAAMEVVPVRHAAQLSAGEKPAEWLMAFSGCLVHRLAAGAGRIAVVRLERTST